MSDMSSNDQMLEMFLFEMSSLLEQLDEVLLSSEKNQSLTGDDVNEVFRIMHTIKGSSAMMEFMIISTVTHKLEDCFFLIRENGIDQAHFTRLFDLMLDATDFLKSQLEAIQNGDPLSEGNDELVARAQDLYAILSGKNAAEAAPAQPAASVPEAAPVTGAAAPADDMPQLTGIGAAYHVEVLFEEDCGMENLRAFMLVEQLRKSCNVISFDPPDVETNPETASHILVNGFAVIVEADMDADVLQVLVEEVANVKNAMVQMVDLPRTETAVITGQRYDVMVTFEEGCSMENLRAFMLLNTLRSTCNIVSFKPNDIENNPESAEYIIKNGFAFTLETGLSQADLEMAVSGAMHVATAAITPVEGGSATAAPVEAAPAPAASNAPTVPVAATAPTAPSVQAQTAPAVETAAKTTSPKPAATNKPIKQNLINVSLSKLDELMDLMGELVITESMVTNSPDLVNIDHMDNFSKSARQLTKLTTELQDMVMSIRMVPVAGTFQKMQRIVRDMCRNLGKEADLVTMGEETDIDKTIVDAISDPIMHLVRNSMDHGVETPEERVANGKSSKATVTLSAQNTGGEILITVSDDGKGLDAEKLLAKARESGILTKPVNEYTEKEAFQLLMAPGFSTKEKVTEYSGRGVGMDVVKKNIEKIGGSVVVESKKGHGMSVFLKIPPTLSIVEGMNISVGSSVYTLQITAISQSFKATKDQIILDTDGNEMIIIRGEVYPVIRLHELYDVPDAITDIEEGILIQVQSGDHFACLFVDQLIGMQQIVVKALPVYLNRYNIKPYGISGCAIMSDGNISLILDAGSIIDMVMDKR